MWRRAVLQVIGCILVVIGVIPLTPLIWLLVLMPSPARMPFRLEFWQTQTIGVLITFFGAFLIYRSSRAG